MIHVKTYKYLPLLLFVSALLSSCFFGYGDNEIPEPVENPLIISSDAQTVNTKVKNLINMTRENPETDKITVNEMVTETESLWSLIETDWISIYHELSPKNHEKLKITVKENNTGHERRYVLGLAAEIKKSSLTIIQEAKK